MFETLGLTLRVFRELPKLESLGKILTALGTTPLVVFYLCSVLGRAHQHSGGLRADLLDQGAATFFRSDAESRRYREVFESFLGLFESAAEARVLAALPKPRP